MKALTFLFSILFISVSAIDQCQVLKLEFNPDTVNLSEVQKSEIIDRYVELGLGNWLNIQTITKACKDKLEELQLTKKRNRRISDFLIGKGLKSSNVIFKYNVVERIWIHKPNHLESAVNVQRKKQQCFAFRNMEGAKLKTEEGNTIVFAPYSFDVFSTDEINVCIEEYITKKDFVKQGVTARGCKGMLESEGMYNVLARCNGLEVKLKRGMSYELQLKNTDSADTYYSFYGQNKGGELMWNKSNSEKFKMKIVVETGIDLLEEEGFYIMWESEVKVLSGSFSKLGWINCDRFYEEEEKIAMNFKIESKDDVNVLVVFHDINSVMPAQKIMDGVYTIEGIPKGQQISIVAINTNDKSNFGELGFVKTITGADQKIDFQTETITDDEMTRLLDDIIY